jgi:polyphosphate kinase 2 (PPK2 family)
MLERTDHAKGRWHVVAGDDKRYARVTVVETVSRGVEAELSERGYDLADESDAT